MFSVYWHDTYYRVHGHIDGIALYNGSIIATVEDAATAIAMCQGANLALSHTGKTFASSESLILELDDDASE